MDPDQTAPIGAVCSGSTMFASILNMSVMLGNYLQQTTSEDDIFICIFFLGALRVKIAIFSHSVLHTLIDGSEGVKNLYFSDYFYGICNCCLSVYVNVFFEQLYVILLLS